MSERRLDSASMEDFRNMAAELMAAKARLAAVEALAEEWERAFRDHGISVYTGALPSSINELRAALHPTPAGTH